MKSIYDIINEANEIESVYVVKGPDDSIVSVWPTEQEANADCDKMNNEVKGKVFTVERDSTKDYIK